MPRDYVKAPDREFEAQVAQFLANRGNPFRMSALLSAMVLLFVATATSWSQSLTWLGTLGGVESVAYGVSADGRVVVGWALNDAGQRRAFRWTESGGMQVLGTLPGGGWSYAFGVSADGRVVVGSAITAAGRWRAFRWTAAGGMEDLNTTYARLLTPGSRLVRATAISPNGRYIVGYGYNAATRREEAFLLDTGATRRVPAEPQQQPQQKPQRKKPQHKELQRTRR
jgi:probable HAF family extracellular repeat protein